LSALLSTKAAKASRAAPVALLGVPACLPPVLGDPFGLPFLFVGFSTLEIIPYPSG
jgi:hypothetical protein